MYATFIFFSAEIYLIVYYVHQRVDDTIIITEKEFRIIPYK